MIYHIVLDLLVYTLIAALASWFYYSYRQRALIGGFWGGLMVGVVGAVITTLLSMVYYDWFIRLFIWLMVPKIGGDFYFRVNIVTAMIGAFLFVSILNRINHNRDRDQP